MIYDFDTVLDRRSSESTKWNRYPPDVLPMWVADMDFVSPAPVVRALQERAAHGVFGYPDGSNDKPGELHALRQTITGHLWQKYHWQVEQEHLVFIPGVVTAFHLACHALVEKHEGVLMQTPVYPPIFKAADTTGRIHQETSLTRDADGTYTVDWEAFEAAISTNTRLFILCNPHNPVGKVFKPDELERLAAICLRHGVQICSDEIHCDLVFSGYNHTPLAALDPEIAQNTITLMSPSKTYNLAGLDCSFAIVPNAETRRRLLNARQGLVGTVNLFGVVAAEAAYCQGQEWLDQLLLYLEANRDYLFDYVKDELPQIRMDKPEGTYLAWLDCRHAGIKGSPYQFFLDAGRLALSDGASFGTGGPGFVRLNFGCPRPLLTDGLTRMKIALDLSHRHGST